MSADLSFRFVPALFFHDATHWGASTSPIASSPVAKGLEAPCKLLQGVGKGLQGVGKGLKAPCKLLQGVGKGLQAPSKLLEGERKLLQGVARA
jgi:hypothetical protein